jgi:hypothetical protein
MRGKWRASPSGDGLDAIIPEPVPVFKGKKMSRFRTINLDVH